MSKLFLKGGYVSRKLVLALIIPKYIALNPRLISDANSYLTFYKSNKLNASDRKKVEHLLLNYPDFCYVFQFRTKIRSWWFKKFFLKHNYASKIFSSTNIEGGMMGFHPYGTVINGKTIGKNFTFRNGLTIGNKGDDNSLLPVIGDNVEVGANVVIIGAITIGNNVTIGAGAVVVKDIPDNAIVAGNPARIIRFKPD